MIDASNIYEPFFASWHIALIAVLYALIRAKHDSYINAGKWKIWAFIEGLFFAAVIAICLNDWLSPLIFAIWFWIAFDIFCGLFRAGKIFYFGSDTFDQGMKQIFEKPVYLFILKVIWLLIIQGIYHSFKI